MKRIPPSQVSFGRGVGQEGRSSGVKDNRFGWAVWVHYTVMQYLHFLSFLSPSTAVGLNRQALCTQLSLAWGPYWQDNFGILHSLPMDTKNPSVCDNTWRVHVNPADPLLYWVNEAIYLSCFLSHLQDSQWLVPLDSTPGQENQRTIWLKAICLCVPMK